MTRWIATSADVYFAIYRQHKDSLCVFATLTDTSGEFGDPTIMTEWGFRAASFPLIRAEGNARHDTDKDYKYEYFIACNMAEDRS